MNTDLRDVPADEYWKRFQEMVGGNSGLLTYRYLGRKTAMERVATFLLEMDRRLAKAGMMALPMSRRDIGDYLGLTLETVSRALSQLNDQGVLIFSSARQIVLRNQQQLTAMDA